RARPEWAPRSHSRFLPLLPMRRNGRWIASDVSSDGGRERQRTIAQRRLGPVLGGVVSHAVSMISRLRRAVVIVVVLRLISSVASAQPTSATLSGAIVDETGAAVADVVIVLVDGATNQRRQVTTTAEGTFVIPLLPPGRYRLNARREGFAALEVP